MTSVPPAVHLPAVGPAMLGAPAGIVSRALAALLDAALVLVTLVAGYAGFVGLLFVSHPTNFTFPSTPLAAIIAVGLVLAAGYLAVSWAATGRTYGDHVLGLRVVARRGGRLRTRWALLRAVGYVVFPIGLAWAAVSRQNSS